MQDRVQLWRRLLLAMAGLCGAVGVASAAASSHGTEARNLGSIALICLSHAPVLLALALAGRGRVMLLGGGILALGVMLFAGDLGIRASFGHGLFPGAAPLGGMGLIAGWLVLVGAAFVWREH